MTQQALLLRINQHKLEAMRYFANNPYVTIHNNTKGDPFTVWIDLNFPVYVVRNGKILKVNGIKDISIQYPSSYPEQRPVVRCNSELICSIHSWSDHRFCLHAKYIASEHNLIKEICHILGLAANCPETINYSSPTPDMRSYVEWTKTSLSKGIIPTVPYKQLTADSSRFKPLSRRSATPKMI